MTPRDVDELSNDELDAFVRYMRQELKEMRKIAARSTRKR